MLGTAVIVFRESLEASLVAAIVLAATRTVPRRGGWIALGFLAGLLGAALVAAFAGYLEALFAEASQEIFNASILFLAVAMLGWHTVWMGRHGRDMAGEIRLAGDAVAAGRRPLYALAIIIGLAVLREGSESVLFVYGVMLSENSSAMEIAAGTLTGLLGGGAIGLALYAGLLRVPLRHLFSVTTVLIVLLAAGMAAQGAGFLLQADLVPALGDEVWDTSSYLPDDSLPARLLHVLIGYTSRPAGIQLVFYALTIAAIAAFLRVWGQAPARRAPARSIAGD